MSKKKRKVVYWYIPSALTIITVPLLRVDGPDSFTSMFFATFVFGLLLLLFYLTASVVAFHTFDLLSAVWSGIRKKNQIKTLPNFSLASLRQDSRVYFVINDKPRMAGR
jgi:hypothetical protein